MPVLFEEVLASVAPEPQVSTPPVTGAAEPEPAREPLSIRLRRQEQRLERLRAD